ATDACGITVSCVQTINVVDTTAPRITCPADTTVDCNASTEPSATGSATATDNCDPQPTISHSDAVTGVCPKIITRTWTATDCAGHNSSCAQQITIADTAAPVITCPTNATVQEYTSTDPSVTGRATAVDNCDPAPTVSYSDVTNNVKPIVITRTWTATDCTGNRSVCTQTITLLEETNGGGTLITDTMRCTLPNNQLRLIFSPDTKNISCYKLTASNPGQFYYNVLYPGTPGSSLTFHVTLPYPWVTQGAKPIEVYDGVTINTSGGQTCLTPGKKVFAGSQQVTLSNYVKPVMGVTTYSFDVTVTVPPTGFVFLAIHLDYGLKASTGYGQNRATDATVCGSAGILIPNGQPYTFSVSGAANDNSTVSSYNTFKKNPGTGGLAQSQTTTFSVPGATAALKDAKGTVLGTGVTDQDGWYLINYKATGKATTYYLTLTPPKGAGGAQTKAIGLKANGYVEADFITP
ncbi:MAG TPA: hypothetical protein VFR76_01985, partial [Verrucomicrobiae bacterium]|nr:hypothetical protein [Verrucomicrobiae bacterium]